MEPILKAAVLQKAELTEQDLALINRQTLRPLEAREVYSFRLAACDNQVDRDGERFTEKALEQLAALFVGRPVLQDHRWSAGMQTARVYAAQVEQEKDVQRLVLRCYMPRTEKTADVITAIEAGILRECSVGVAVERVLCSICGCNQREAWCRHMAGQEYDEKTCVMELDGAADAYEVSLVAVPAQPGAGAVKSKRYGGPEEEKKENWQDKALLDLEKNRF